MTQRTHRLRTAARFVAYLSMVAIGVTLYLLGLWALEVPAGLPIWRQCLGGFLLAVGGVCLAKA